MSPVAGFVDRMAVTGLAVTPEQHIVRGIEEEDVRARAGPIERIQLLLGVGEERPAPSVDHEGHLLFATLTGYLDRRGHQRGREIVEGVVAEVLEDLYRL